MSVSSISSGSTAAVQQVRHHGHHSGARKAGMDAAAGALSMSGSDLQTALQSGQTLGSLAKTKRIDPADLTKAIGDAIGKANPSISSDRAQKIAQRMIDGPDGASSGAVAGAASSSSTPGMTGTTGVDRDNDGDGR